MKYSAASALLFASLAASVPLNGPVPTNDAAPSTNATVPSNSSVATHVSDDPAASTSDTLFLDYALQLRHLESALFAEGLSNYSASAFTAAGFRANTRSQVEALAADQASQVDALATAIAEAGGSLSEPCQYNFDLRDVTGFLALASVFEGLRASAYLWAARNNITASQYLLPNTDMRNVELEHSASEQVLGDDTFPHAVAADAPLNMDEVYSIMQSFVVRCPASNPKLSLSTYPLLKVSAHVGPYSRDSAYVDRFPVRSTIQLSLTSTELLSRRQPLAAYATARSPSNQHGKRQRSGAMSGTPVVASVSTTVETSTGALTSQTGSGSYQSADFDGPFTNSSTVCAAFITADGFELEPAARAASFYRQKTSLYTVRLPASLHAGQNYVVLVSCDAGAVSDETILAGPAIIKVAAGSTDVEYGRNATGTGVGPGTGTGYCPQTGTAAATTTTALIGTVTRTRTVSATLSITLTGTPTQTRTHYVHEGVTSVTVTGSAPSVDATSAE